MGEEAKQEATKAEVEDKKEEKSTEEKPKPPAPCVLFVDLHCVGCAKKIEKSITKIRGVQGVVIDMAQNQVTIKGIIEPQAICNRIMKKTKRRAKVLSPIPEAEGDPIPQVATSQVSGSTTVELNVNMHCEACAEQLKKKILKMRGVQTATTELITGKVTVSGTMDASKLVDYVYRRTKKQARIIPQPEPEREVKQEEKMEEAEKQPPLPPEEEAKPAEETKKEAEGKPPEEEGKTETTTTSNPENDDKAAKKPEEQEGSVSSIVDEESIKRMMNYYYQPLYVIERIPPPQIFSDENPNACSIS